MKERGQSLVEIVIALAIGAVIIGGASTAVVVVLQSGSTTQTQQTATVLAQDMVESARSFADTNWHNVTNLTQGSSTTYYFNATSTSIFAVQGKEGIVEGNVTAGLVGHWQLDEAAGTTAYDATGNGNNGTLINGTSHATSTCEIGYCLSFNGTTNYVDVAETTSSLDVTNALTFAAWIYPTSVSSYAPILAKIPPAYGSGYEFANSSGNLRTTLRTSGGNCDFSQGALTANAWQFVVATYDGTVTRHYINGALSATSPTCTLGAAANNNDLYLGGRASDASRFAGLIDDVRIYNRALSADEVHNLYNSTVFTRSFYVEEVCRTNDANYNIAGVAPCGSGQVNDPSTRKITSVIQWNTKQGAQTFDIPFYVTRWRNRVFDQSDWSGGSGATGPVTDTTNGYSSSTNLNIGQGSLKIQGL